jgi:hypothetical protein
LGLGSGLELVLQEDQLLRLQVDMQLLWRAEFVALLERA